MFRYVTRPWADWIVPDQKSGQSNCENRDCSRSEVWADQLGESRLFQIRSLGRPTRRINSLTPRTATKFICSTARNASSRIKPVFCENKRSLYYRFPSFSLHVLTQLPGR